MHRCMMLFTANLQVHDKIDCWLDSWLDGPAPHSTLYSKFKFWPTSNGFLYTFHFPEWNRISDRSIAFIPTTTLLAVLGFRRRRDSESGRPTGTDSDVAFWLSSPVAYEGQSNFRWR